MNKLILFILLCFSFSYNSKACIVAQPNSISLNGPNTVCSGVPTGHYNLNYSSDGSSPFFYLTLAIKGGFAHNWDPIGIPDVFGGNCSPVYIAQFVSGCTRTYRFEVPRVCIGSVGFTAKFSNHACVDKSITYTLHNSNMSAIQTGTLEVMLDPACFIGDEDDNLNLSITSESYMNEYIINQKDDPDLKLIQKIETNTDIRIDKDLKLDIFPNPSPIDADVTLSLSGEYESNKVQILDSNGKIVRVYNNVKNQLSIETSQMTNSLYFIRVIAEDGQVKTKKLILSK